MAGKGNPYHKPGGKGGGQFTTGPGGGSWSVTVPKGVDPELQNAVSSAFEDLASRYKIAVTVKMSSGDNGTAWHYPGATRIDVNSAYWGNGRKPYLDQAIKETTAIDEWPIGEYEATGPGLLEKSPEDILKHEYGHVLFSQLEKDSPKVAEALLNDIDEMKGETPDGIDPKKLGPFVDTYGAYAASLSREAIGEAFRAHENGEKTPLAELVGNAFKRYRIKGQQ